MSGARAPRLDLAEVRAKVVKLLGVQLLLLVGLLVFLVLVPPEDAKAWARVAWMALAPLLLALWGWLSWKALERAAAGGASTEGVDAANRYSQKLLNGLVIAWGLGLVVVIFLL